MPRLSTAAIALALALATPGVVETALAQDLPVVLVTEDDTRIDQSCRIQIPEGRVIADANGDGAIHIVASGITVEMSATSRLRGAKSGTAWDQLTGVGIRIQGQKDVVIRRARVHGFKVGVWATGCDGLEINRMELSDNYRQRLRSTPRAEHASDWLSPHHNDRHEWIELYGAALYLERSKGVTLRRIRVRRGQNGILIDRVEDSLIYDNDCSFLSGWGLGMWRSCRNSITRNAFDFCVRGYSHGVYNRGQDSAGILMFEQCCENTLAENSATHGGDGLFGFAGVEALGQEETPSGFDHQRRGNNDNLLFGNDFSDAAAHGIEMTFSFGNKIYRNLLGNNGICGIWAGYSQQTSIIANIFVHNGELGHGLERGGVNIEHGVKNRIHDNQFLSNKCGIHLWWDPDPALMDSPWAKANRTGCADNEVTFNLFKDGPLALHLRDATGTLFADNKTVDMDEIVRVEGGDAPIEVGDGDVSWTLPLYFAKGRARPVGQRSKLTGRDKIVMGEWGPWDHESPLVRLTPISASSHRFDVFGVHELEASLIGPGLVFQKAASDSSRAEFLLHAPTPGVYPYRIAFKGVDFSREQRGTLVAIEWDLCVFSWTKDPRTDLAGWMSEAESGQRVRMSQLNLDYGGGGPRDLALSDEITAEGPGADRFGTLARSSLALGKGKWEIVTWSDDGVRVRVDGDSVIDNWTWHGPTRNQGVFEVFEDRTVAIEVDHFEIDGHAVLRFDIRKLKD